MCRFVLYLGPPITLDLLTTRPAFSIIHQSYKSRMRVEPLNGDGFGVAWYVPSISPEPAVFRSVQPAWNNMNLRDLARVTRSSAILAHIRAATAGMGVSQENCHPFAVGRLTFMHNGSVPEFLRLKRRLQERLSDEAFSQINGTTDSEHVFALFRDHLARLDGEPSTETLAGALEQTIAEVVDLAGSVETTRNALLNFAVCDGKQAVVSRYTSGEGEAPSLYLHTGKKYVCEDGVCRMVEADQEHQAVMIASEPLTEEPSWHPVPTNHVVLVRPDHSIECRPIGGRPGRAMAIHPR
jgi:glutamine amidotransferase